MNPDPFTQLASAYRSYAEVEGRLSDWLAWQAGYEKPVPGLVGFTVGQVEDARNKARDTLITAVAAVLEMSDQVTALKAATQAETTPFSCFNDHGLRLSRIRSRDSGLIIEVHGERAPAIGLAIVSLLDALLEEEEDREEL